MFLLRARVGYKMFKISMECGPQTAFVSDSDTDWLAGSCRIRHRLAPRFVKCADWKGCTKAFHV